MNAVGDLTMNMIGKVNVTIVHRDTAINGRLNNIERDPYDRNPGGYSWRDMFCPRDLINLRIGPFDVKGLALDHPIIIKENR